MIWDDSESDVTTGKAHAANGTELTTIGNDVDYIRSGPLGADSDCARQHKGMLHGASSVVALRGKGYRRA